MTDYIIIFLLIIVFIALIYLVRSKKTSGNENEKVYLSNQVESLRNQIDTSLTSLSNLLQNEFKISNDNFKDQNFENQRLVQRINEFNNETLQKLSKELTTLKETNTQILGLTSQIGQLSNVLNNSKKRGILGEILLENLLRSILPVEIYELQYMFKDGTKVDAVIHFNKQLIPIDAKFSLEKFNSLINITDEIEKNKQLKEFLRDVRKRIDETSKYIKEDEDTANIAIMFIPADGIYTEILESENMGSEILEYAFSKNVIIVSPITFYAYLQTLLLAMKNLNIQKNATLILKYLKEIGKSLNDLDVEVIKMGRSLNATLTNFEKVNTTSQKIVIKFGQIESLTPGEDN